MTFSDFMIQKLEAIDPPVPKVEGEDFVEFTVCPYQWVKPTDPKYFHIVIRIPKPGAARYKALFTDAVSEFSRFFCTIHKTYSHNIYPELIYEYEKELKNGARTSAEATARLRPGSRSGASRSGK